jgi:hypothetical protein
MARDLYPSYQFGQRVSARTIDPAEFNDRKLQAGEEIAIWSTQVPADKGYVWGVGANNKDSGDANFVYAEFLESGNGAGTDGTVINDAEVVLAITDSTREDTLAKTTLNPDAEDLADAKASDRTDRPIVAEHAPYASEDRHLELRLRARSGADGVEVGNDSNIKLKYGVVG